MKWAYKVKVAPIGEVTRHKARLISKRFLQKEGIDFYEVFAPIVRIETLKLLIALANINSWSMCQMDVKYVFLNDPLDEKFM